MLYEELFEIARVTADTVVVKVKPIDNLTRATYSWMCANNVEYIAVTRGKSNHTMSFIKTDGTSWSIDWGDSGCTLCSNNLNTLKWNVVYFIQEHGISLETRDNRLPEQITIYKTHFGGKWQVNFEYANSIREYMYPKDVATLQDAMDFAETIFSVDEWTNQIAETGITMWVATVLDREVR